jgi:hypothetical protein
VLMHSNCLMAVYVILHISLTFICLEDPVIFSPSGERFMVVLFLLCCLMLSFFILVFKFLHDSPFFLHG